MTTILIKKKDTAGAPAAGDLTNAAGGTEIAVNTATKRIYTKDSGGNVVEVGTNPTATTMNGNLTFVPDATYDIGATGATRPRDIFMSRNLVVGGTLTLAGGVNLNGNVTIGDASSDTLTINSTITSNLIFTDNTYDIGASGATRPRNVYLSGQANTKTLNVDGTFGAAGTGNTVLFNGGTGTLSWYPRLTGGAYSSLVQADDTALISGPNTAYGLVVGKHDGASIRFGVSTGNLDFAVNNGKSISLVYSASGPNGLQWNNNTTVRYVFGNAAGGAIGFYADAVTAGTRGLRLGSMNGAITTFTSQVDINQDYNAVSIGAVATANSTGLNLAYNSTTLASRNFFTINNRGTDTTQTGSYNVGGILWGGYRDVRNPANISGIWTIRDNASSGLASTGYLVFGVAGGGGNSNINQDGTLPDPQMYVEQGGVGVGARAYFTASVTLGGSFLLGHNAATTGDFMSSGGGNTSTYNGVAIISNALALNAQANTALPSWIVDIGGRAADGTTFPVGTQNRFRVAYRSAGGSLYSATDWLSIASNGKVTVNGMIDAAAASTSVPSTTNTALYMIGAAYGNAYWAGQYYSGATAKDVFMGMLPNSVSGSTDSWGLGTVTAGVYANRLMMNSSGNIKINNNTILDGNNEPYTFRYVYNGNATYAYDQTVYNRSLGNTGDPSYGYVLLCEAYQGGATQAKAYFTGFIYWLRGGASAGNYSFGCYVMVSSAYNSNVTGGKNVGNGTIEICQVTISSVKYLACRMPYTSSGDVYVSGTSAAGFAPQIASDASVSAVTVLQTLAV